MKTPALTLTGVIIKGRADNHYLMHSDCLATIADDIDYVIIGPAIIDNPAECALIACPHKTR